MSKKRFIELLWKIPILMGICVVAFYFFDLEGALFWTLFFAFLFFGWDNRYVGALAILALTACPILLALELDTWAEQMAVYAYYFLVMTVALQIIEFKRYPEGQNEERTHEVPTRKGVVDLRAHSNKAS